MREIKFRAWDTEEHKFIDNLLIDNQGISSTFNPDDGVWGKENDVRYKVMQYTGLKDKNGKEIYEGDVMRILYTDWPSQTVEKNGRYSMSLEEYKKSISSIGFVQWENDRWVINFGKGRFGDDETGRMDAGPHGEKEIIGNIYENPELVEN